MRVKGYFHFIEKQKRRRKCSVSGLSPKAMSNNGVLSTEVTRLNAHVRKMAVLALGTAQREQEGPFGAEVNTVPVGWAGEEWWGDN